jgi:O-antigen ligase
MNEQDELFISRSSLAVFIVSLIIAIWIFTASDFSFEWAIVYISGYILLLSAAVLVTFHFLEYERLIADLKRNEVEYKRRIEEYNSMTKRRSKTPPKLMPRPAKR